MCNKGSVVNRQRNLWASSQQPYAFIHIGEHTLLHCSGVEWMPIRLTIPRQNSFPHGRSVFLHASKFIDMPTVCDQFVHLTQAFSFALPWPHDLPQYLGLGDSHH